MSPRRCATCGHPISDDSDWITTERGPVHTTAACLGPWWNDDSEEN